MGQCSRLVRPIRLPDYLDLYLVFNFVVGFYFASFGLFSSPYMVTWVCTDGTVFSVFNRTFSRGVICGLFYLCPYIIAGCRMGQFNRTDAGNLVISFCFAPFDGPVVALRSPLIYPITWKYSKVNKAAIVLL